MEHIEEAGVHSGDSACAIPPYSLPGPVVDEIREATCQLARHLDVRGLMNIQFAVKKEDGRPTVYVLEVNPRASRTVPFVSKATGVPWAKAAAKVMVGVTLAEQGITREPIPACVSVKEAVFPFVQVHGRRHRAGAGDEIDRRGDGRERPLLHRLRQEPVGGRDVPAHQRQRVHQRGRAAEGPRGRAWPGGWRSSASRSLPPAARRSGSRRRAFACSG